MICFLCTLDGTNAEVTILSSFVVQTMKQQLGLLAAHIQQHSWLPCTAPSICLHKPVCVLASACGLELRKAAFECMDVLLARGKDRINMADFISHLEQGLQVCGPPNS